MTADSFRCASGAFADARTESASHASPIPHPLFLLPPRPQRCRHRSNLPRPTPHHRHQHCPQAPAALLSPPTSPLPMASHLRLHLAAPPPLPIHHHHRLRLPRLPKPPLLLNFPAPASLLLRPRLLSSAPLRASVDRAEEGSDGEGEGLVGEDSAVFRLGDQRVVSWAYFSGILAVVLYGLNVLWIDPATGFGTSFLDAVASVSDSHEVVLLLLIIIFAVAHSGMASLRETGEKIIGERAYRVLFAGLSLPLAVSTIVYFINHRYDGIQLWQVQGIPGIHELVWLSSFISFLFLYPSTFNLLEVAAVDKPKLHMWETGIMRITRHPQFVGQVIWCLAHTLWMGNSVAVAASVGLIGHHAFGVWNGDRRLASRYGEAFEVLKKRTSVIPFAAIVDGRQKLPGDYYKEFIRLPYITITALTLGAYFAHPLMQASSYKLPW